MIFSTVVKNDLHICSFPSTNIGRMNIFIQTYIVCPLPRVLHVLVLQVTLDPQSYSTFSNPRLQNLTLSYAAYFYPLVPDVEGGEGTDPTQIVRVPPYEMLVFLKNYIFFRRNEIILWGKKRSALFQTHY